MANYRHKVARWESLGGFEKQATDIAEAAIMGAMMNPQGSALGSGGRTLLTKMAALVGVKALDTADPSLDTLGYRLNRWFHGGFKGLMDRVQADEVFAKTIVDGLSQTTLDVAKDALSSGIQSASQAYHEANVASPMRHSILSQLKNEDVIIGGAPKKDLMEAYHTMVTFAPSLSTDKNAVKSFLRQAVQHEGGVDYMSIKGLAEAENAISGKPKDR